MSLKDIKKGDTLITRFDEELKVELRLNDLIFLIAENDECKIAQSIYTWQELEKLKCKIKKSSSNECIFEARCNLHNHNCSLCFQCALIPYCITHSFFNCTRNIKKEEPLKLELGKVYEDKDSNRWLIINFADGIPTQYNAVNLKNGASFWFYVNGSIYVEGISNLLRLSPNQRPFKI